MNPINFAYKQSNISYYRFGKGEKVLVAFHGYGQTGAHFQYFEDALGDCFTIIAIDFFWHGNSAWNENSDFTEDDMRQIAMGITKKEQLKALKLSVCSFSMGSRMARALVRVFPKRVEHFILLSPPTFAFNRFLDFTTNNPVGLKMFRYFVKHNEALLKWTKRLYQSKILNRSVYVFSSKFIGQPKRLEKVFKTWYAQRKLQTDFRSFAHLLDKHKIETILIVGKNDPITPPNGIIKFVKKLKYKKIFIVEQKHELQTPETRVVLQNLFEKKQTT